MSDFDEKVIERLKRLEREVERLQVKERPDKTGWIPVSDTWTYVSATSFKITGKDVRDRFPKGTKIKLVQSGSQKYFYVIATAFSTDTTITITGGSDYSLANEAISGQAYSYAAAPQGFNINATGGTWIYNANSFTSGLFDGGDAFSSCDMTLIDLSSVFGIPAGVKAVDVRIVIRDSGSASTPDLDVHLSATNTDISGRACIVSGLPNNCWAEQNMVVPCNSDGDIYYQVRASGTNTMNIYMVIFGYLL